MITTKVIWHPTTEDLDNPNIHFLNREPLLQERFQTEHKKGIKVMQNEIKKIKTKLAEIKRQQVTDQAGLERLREKRARLFVEDLTKHSKQIAKLDTDIEKLQTFITGLPDVITVLEGQLQTANAKFAAEARDELLNTQKKVTEQTTVLSKELVAKLKEAVETNQKLRQKYAEYKQLSDLTKIDFLGNKFAEPSQQMLDYLYGFLSGELQGKHCRLTLSPPCPQI
ncbi:MAG: hypothetical protein WBC05_16150 [Sedimentisphaerales bacterium]